MKTDSVVPQGPQDDLHNTVEDCSVAPSGRSPMMDRRALMRRGAIAGATLAWAVPTVQVISMTAAAAQTPSGVQPPPGDHVTPPPGDHTTPPSSHHTTWHQRNHSHGGSTDTANGQHTWQQPTDTTSDDVKLADTGVSGLTTGAGIAGVGLVAGGAAAVYAGRRMKRPASNSAPADSLQDKQKSAL